MNNDLPHNSLLRDSTLETGKLARKFNGLASELEGHLLPIEPQFLGLGTLLENLHATSTRLIEQPESLQGWEDDTNEMGPFLHALATFLPDNIHHLQLGDIARQRCEHVAAALREIARWLENARSQIDLRIRVAEADCIAAIQVEQLATVRNDLDCVSQHLRSQLAATLRLVPINRLRSLTQDFIGQLREAAMSLHDELAFIDHIARDTAELRTQLIEARSALSPHLDGSVDTSDVLARFEATYTMASERRAHWNEGPTHSDDSPDVEIF